MPNHTTPIKRFVPGMTGLTAKRLNDVADQLTRVARDQRKTTSEIGGQGQIRGIWAVVTKCNKVTGLYRCKRTNMAGSTTAAPNAHEFTAYAFPYAFPQTGDAVACIPMTGSPKWLITMNLPCNKYQLVTPLASSQINPSVVTGCTDTVT